MSKSPLDVKWYRNGELLNKETFGHRFRENKKHMTLDIKAVEVSDQVGALVFRIRAPCVYTGVGGGGGGVGVGGSNYAKESAACFPELYIKQIHAYEEVFTRGGLYFYFLFTVFWESGKNYSRN